MDELRAYICKRSAISVVGKGGFIVQSNAAIIEFPNWDMISLLRVSIWPITV